MLKELLTDPISNRFSNQISRKYFLHRIGQPVFAVRLKVKNVERTQTGKSVARQNPNFRDGRPKKFSATQRAHAVQLLDAGMSYKQVEDMTGISKSTLIRAKKERAS